MSLEQEWEEITKFLSIAGHPLAFQEPLIEKVRNLCAIIHSQSQLIEELEKEIASLKRILLPPNTLRIKVGKIEIGEGGCGGGAGGGAGQGGDPAM